MIDFQNFKAHVHQKTTGQVVFVVLEDGKKSFKEKGKQMRKNEKEKRLLKKKSKSGGEARRRKD